MTATNLIRLSDPSFFTRDVLTVAPELTGKYLVRQYPDGTTQAYLITETEAYRGEEDKACHASKGCTPRTQVMYEPGGVVYMYLIYGMYWMLNIVTGPASHPQAVLIRAIEGANGPGKLTRTLMLDRSFYGENLCTSDRIWIADAGLKPAIKTSPRIGIDYAGEFWANQPWRFILQPH